jgi:hypothetical protein
MAPINDVGALGPLLIAVIGIGSVSFQFSKKGRLNLFFTNESKVCFLLHELPAIQYLLSSPVSFSRAETLDFDGAYA